MKNSVLGALSVLAMTTVMTASLAACAALDERSTNSESGSVATSEDGLTAAAQPYVGDRAEVASFTQTPPGPGAFLSLAADGSYVFIDPVTGGNVEQGRWLVSNVATPEGGSKDQLMLRCKGGSIHTYLIYGAYYEDTYTLTPTTSDRPLTMKRVVDGACTATSCDGAPVSTYVCIEVTANSATHHACMETWAEFGTVAQ